MRLALAVVLILAVGVSGVAAQAPPVSIAFATLDTGSAWYVYGATMAELLRRSLPQGSNIDVKPRAGGVGNPRLVAKNETPLGFGFTVTNRWAYEGKEAYTEKLENLRGLVGGLDTYYLVAVAAKKLGISSVREIKDKKLPVKVYTQPIGALGEFAGRQLLRAAGMSYADIKSWGGWQLIFDESTRLAGKLARSGWIDESEVADLSAGIRATRTYRDRVGQVETHDGI